MFNQVLDVQYTCVEVYQCFAITVDTWIFFAFTDCNTSKFCHGLKQVVLKLVKFWWTCSAYIWSSFEHTSGCYHPCLHLVNSHLWATVGCSWNCHCCRCAVGACFGFGRATNSGQTFLICSQGVGNVMSTVEWYEGNAIVDTSVLVAILCCAWWGYSYRL